MLCTILVACSMLYTYCVYIVFLSHPLQSPPQDGLIRKLSVIFRIIMQKVRLIFCITKILLYALQRQKQEYMALIHRQLQSVIRDRLFKGKAIVLIGARQVGKSTLFRQVLSECDELPCPSDKILILDCDDPQVRLSLSRPIWTN